jgi:hypothetical protein
MSLQSGNLTSLSLGQILDDPPAQHYYIVLIKSCHCPTRRQQCFTTSSTILSLLAIDHHEIQIDQYKGPRSRKIVGMNLLGKEQQAATTAAGKWVVRVVRSSTTSTMSSS